MVDIGDGVWDKYREFADDFISSNFGVNCRIVYPALIVDCPNCVHDYRTGKSANIYKAGGPVSFTYGVCPYCAGEGKREDISAAEIIKLRCYFDKKSWIKIRDVVSPDGVVQIIGFLYDAPKVLKADHLILNSDQENYISYKYRLDGELQPHGFKKDRYFVGFARRSE